LRTITASPRPEARWKLSLYLTQLRFEPIENLGQLGKQVVALAPDDEINCVVPTKHDAFADALVVDFAYGAGSRVPHPSPHRLQLQNQGADPVESPR
jgi:hypothetical protein